MWKKFEKYDFKNYYSYRIHMVAWYEIALMWMPQKLTNMKNQRCPRWCLIAWWYQTINCTSIGQALCRRMVSLGHNELTHLSLVPHICVESGQHWFYSAYSVPNHQYLNQRCVIVRRTLKNKLQWNFNQNTKLFIHENASENIAAKWRPFCPGGRWVKHQPNLFIT